MYIVIVEAWYIDNVTAVGLLYLLHSLYQPKNGLDFTFQTD